METLNNSIIELILTVITGVISFVGIRLKTIYKEKINDETVKKIVTDTVKYVEQITKDISITSENKKQKAKDKILQWLDQKGLSISDVELDILIESAVNSLKGKSSWLKKE